MKKSIMHYLPSIFHLHHFVTNPLIFMQTMHKQNGEIFSTYLGYKKFHFIAAPDLAEHVLNTNSHYFRKSKLIFDKIKSITGEQGLIQLEGKDWQEMRQITNNVFHRTQLDYYKIIIAQYTDKLIAEMKEMLTTSNVMDISSLMIRNTMRIAMHLFFGTSYDQKAALIAEKFIQLNYLCGHSMRKVFSHPFMPTKLNRQIRRIQNELDTIFSHLSESSTKAPHSSLLETLKIKLKYHQDKHRLIKDQMMTFMFAGYETTASSLTFCFYLLAKHQFYQQKIYNELQNQSSKQVDCVYREALRLYPPAYMLAREAKQSHDVNGLVFKKGDNIILSLYEMHRNNKYWKDSHHFIPERFLKQNISTVSKFTFIPFGYGKQVCSGMQLAFVEAEIILKKLIEHFILTVADDAKIQLEAMVTLHPKEAVNIMVKPR